MIHAFAPEMERIYNKFYIGMAKDGMPDNFVVFRAKKQSLRLERRLESSEEVQKMIDQAYLDVLDHEER